MQTWDLSLKSAILKSFPDSSGNYKPTFMVALMYYINIVLSNKYVLLIKWFPQQIMDRSDTTSF